MIDLATLDWVLNVLLAHIDQNMFKFIGQEMADINSDLATCSQLDYTIS